MSTRERVRSGARSGHASTSTSGRVYDTGGYDLRLRYADDPAPPLDADTSARADARLRDAGLR